jgi:hypothetical protein
MGGLSRAIVHGRTVILADSSGGDFNAAGDFDRLLPVSGKTFPALTPAGLVQVRQVTD